MTDILLYIILCTICVAAGRVSVKSDLEFSKKPFEDQVEDLNNKIAYYKKLTRELSQENTELRRKLNVSK
jgi:chaperonin cofactor prefoldin